MKSSFYETPPGTLFNLIATGGEHTQLQTDYGAYRSAISSVKNVNSIGANMSALRFQQTFLLPGTCPGSIANPKGVPIPLSVLQATNPGFDDETTKPGLGPLVLNLGPLR